MAKRFKVYSVDAKSGERINPIGESNFMEFATKDSAIDYAVDLQHSYPDGPYYFVVYDCKLLCDIWKPQFAEVLESALAYAYVCERQHIDPSEEKARFAYVMDRTTPDMVKTCMQFAHHVVATYIYEVWQELQQDIVKAYASSING